MNKYILSAQKAFFLTVLFVCFVVNSYSANYYFSSSQGNDARSFSEAQNEGTPWKTIDKLNSVIGQLQPGDAVLFKSGDIFYGSIVITKSGSNGNPIAFSNYGSGSKPQITGFTSVSDWANVGGNIWEATVPAAQQSVNSVLVNDVFKQIGRYPNADAANGGYLTFESAQGNSSITDNQLSGTPNWTGGEVVIRKVRWVIDRNTVTQHQGNTISYNSQSGYGASAGYGYFIQNHPQTLDQDGEWYFKADGKKFGIYAGGGSPAPGSIKVSTAQTLVSANNQSNIIFSNLVFSGANNNTFDLNNARGINISNCEIYYSGHNAINGQNANNISVETSIISNTNNVACNLENSNYVSLKKNIITNTGSIAGMGDGDSGGYEAILMDGHDQLIEGNTITNTGYIAITFRGDNVVVKNNVIDKFSYVKDDGSGIYTWNNPPNPPVYTSRVITGNIVLNGIGAGPGTPDPDQQYANGIYMDDNAGGVEISGNTVANCANYGLYIHNGHDLVIKDNTVYNNAIQINMTQDNIANAPVRNVTLTGNTFVSKLPSQSVAEFKTNENDIASFGTFDYNYYSRPLKDNLQIGILHRENGNYIWNTYDLDAWKALYGKDQNSKKSPFPIAPYSNPDDSIRFVYNTEAVSRSFALDNNYADIANNNYSGSITLAPYTSSVLLKRSSNQPPPENVICSATGNILREQWDNVGGNDVSNIPLQTPPTNTSQLTIFESPTDIADNYGARIRGYICPPQTGNYTFWIAADDASELWLSTDDNASNKVKIAYSLSWTYPREWNKYATQRSGSIYLQAGHKYYIEALHKEGAGGDNLAVAWQLPSGTMEAPIPGTRLSPFLVVKTDQTINFSSINAKTYGDAPFTVNATATSGLPVSFTIVSGPGTISGNTVTITNTGTIQIQASQSGNSSYNAANSITQNVIVNAAPTTNCSATGSILREQWNNVGGNDVSNIPLQTPPTNTSQLTIFESPTDIADNYGARIRGYICPPQTGNYTFWIAADDASELWLSTDDNASNKVKIAYSLSWTYPREWNKYATQRSGSIYLQAGHKYYIEALHKEGAGGDNLAVAWQLPSGTMEAPIPGTRLSPFTAAIEAPLCSNTGNIIREQWNNINGHSINSIPLNTPPATISTLTIFESPTDVAENYGARIRGYICPPQTGNYTFWIAADDVAELWVSTTDNETNKIKIASVPAYTGVREWNKYTSQKSVTIFLQAGQRYYVEALQKEGDGGDNLAVAWQLPNGVMEAPIPGVRLSPYTNTSITEFAQSLNYIADIKTQKIVDAGKSGLSVYPNPLRTTTTIEVKLPENNTINLQLYDEQGRMLKPLYSGLLDKNTTKRITLNAEQLTSGVYIVRLTTQTKTISKKIIVQK